MLRLALCIMTMIAASPLKAELRLSPELATRTEELARWIELHSDYEPMQKQPVYIFLSQEELNYIFFGLTPAGYTGKEQSSVVALYHKGIVFLTESFELGVNDDVLLHELVHHLQAEQNRQYPCVRAGERDAYKLQESFIEETGMGEPLDPMWAHLAARCEDF